MTKSILKLSPLCAALAILCAPAVAQDRQLPEFSPCEDVWAAQVIFLHLGDDGRGIRSFANGRVRLFQLDTEEPAVYPGGVAIVTTAAPNENEGGLPAVFCHAAHGYTGIDVEAATADYDPATGLDLNIPVVMQNENGMSNSNYTVRLRINTRDGSIMQRD